MREGVTLEQYAGVSAAVIEGFPLASVLESEGLDAAAWARASLRWSERLAADGAGGGLAAVYRDTVAFARAWLGRRVAPLEDDLRAWLGFLNAWSSHPAPFDLLDDLGILPSDVARIQGAWARKMEQDQALRAAALDIAKRKPSEVPKVTVTRATLKPFPWTKKHAPVEESALVRPKMLSMSYVGDAIGLERYAALLADLRRAKADRAQVLARQTLDEEGFAEIEARWRRRFEVDPTLEQDCRRLARYYEARLSARAQKVAGGEDVGRSVERAPTEPAGAPEARPRLADLAGTSLALDVPRKLALPFVEGSAPATGAASREEGGPRAAPPPSALGGTSLALDVPRGPTLPFAGARAPAPAQLAGTSLALDVPPKPALPFVEGAAQGKDTPPPATLKIKQPPAGLGGTSLALDVPRGPALPFPPAAEAAPRKRDPFAEASLDLRAALVQGAAARKPPALTLEQHASLTLEIALAPERAMETLRRYGLTPEAKRTADEHYREKVAGSPEVRAAWNRAYEAHHARVTGKRPSQP